MFFHLIFIVSLNFLCCRLIMITLFKESSCFFLNLVSLHLVSLHFSLNQTRHWNKLNNALPHHQMVVINYSSTILFQNYELKEKILCPYSGINLHSAERKQWKSSTECYIWSFEYWRKTIVDSYTHNYLRWALYWHSGKCVDIRLSV